MDMLKTLLSVIKEIEAIIVIALSLSLTAIRGFSTLKAFPTTID